MQHAFFDSTIPFERAEALQDSAAQDSTHGRTASQLESVVVALLDELDYGVILLRDAVHVVHLNHAARAELRVGHSVDITDGTLRARCAADATALGEAMLAAAHRGLRRFVTLGAEDQRLGVALIPIGAPASGKAGLTVAVFGRRRLCERITVQWFARAHGLTPAECTVLELLCDGLDPRDIARANEVGMTTVRTQVSSIRIKVGADSIRGLLHKVAMLPPMVSSLRC